MKGINRSVQRIPEPQMSQLTGLARDVDLQPDLGSYLMWLVGDLRRIWGEANAAIDFAQMPQATFDSEIRRLWSVGLEHEQVITGLVACELERRGYKTDAQVIRTVKWMLPRIWAEGRASTMVAETTYLSAPLFPTDSAFGSYSPGARDQHAGEIAAATEAKFYERATNLPGGHL